MNLLDYAKKPDCLWCSYASGNVETCECRKDCGRPMCVAPMHDEEEFQMPPVPKFK